MTMELSRVERVGLALDQGEARAVTESESDENAERLDEILSRQLGDEMGDVAGRSVPHAGSGDAEEDDDWGLPVAVLAQQPGEFVCRVCHLIKSRSQIEPPSLDICHDCAVTLPTLLAS